MKRKALILGALLLLLPILMVACTDTSDSTGESSTTANGSNTTTEAGNGDEDLRESSLVTLDLVTMSSGKNEPDIGLVEDEMNKLLEEKFNVNVELTFIPFGNYADQITLMLSSGDSADLLPVYMIPLPSAAHAGQILPLDDLLDQFGSGIKSELGDYLEAGRVDGQIYGVTTGRDLASAEGFAMKKSIVDDLDIDTEAIKTLDDLEKVLETVRDNTENVWPVVVSAGENIRNWGWDPLGDDIINLGVLPNMGEDSTVVNHYETDTYKELVTRMHEWMGKGLIQADAVNTTESATTLLQAGTGFGYFTNLKPGYAEENSSALGFDITVVEFVSALASTNNVSRATWTISSGTDHPEAAMKVLNDLYSNPDLSNLYMYGVEGTHYQVVEAGGASNGQDIIDWAEGVDATSSNYRKSGTWLQPNQFVGHVWNGSASDIWEQQQTFNQDARKSIAFGFTFDSVDVLNQVTAATNVVAKYNKALMAGALDPATTLEQFNAELYSAGLQDIIDAKQAQLDEWLATQGG